MNRRQFTCYAFCVLGAQCLSLPLFAQHMQKYVAWTKLKEFAFSRHCSIFPRGAGESETALYVLEPICWEIAANPAISTSQIGDCIRSSIIRDIKLRRVMVVSAIEISATDRALQVLGVMSHEELAISELAPL